jgi:hypothetical protein
VISRKSEAEFPEIMAAMVVFEFITYRIGIIKKVLGFEQFSFTWAAKNYPGVELGLCGLPSEAAP